MNGYERLSQTRARALERLESDAKLSELRGAAADLGTTLVETADDEDLWARLADASARVQTLTDKQRLGLRAAVEVDWAPLLDAVGYQPPPPAEGYAIELVDAIEAALENRVPTNAQTARERVRALGLTLVEVSQQTQGSPSRLRRWLLRGVRVAGKVLVVFGVAHAGAALMSAAPGSAALSPFLPEVVDVLKTSTVRVLESALNRVLPAEGGDSDAVDTSDYDVQEIRLSVRPDELGRLLASWTIVANLGPSPAAETALRELELVEKSPQFVEHAIRALYRAWDAAIGALWYTRDLAAGSTC